MLPCIIFLLVVSGFDIASTNTDECAAAKKKCDDDGSTAVKAATKISDKCDAAKAWRQCINNLEDSCKDLTFSDDLTRAESDNCPTPGIPKPCPQAKNAKLSVKKNGVCYNYFMETEDRLNWEDAGQFCRNNSLGDLPLVSTQDDKDLLASIIKSADPLASGGWIGGNMDGDLCNILLVENAHTEQWHCKIAHSFLCAVEPERLITDTELGLWCPAAKDSRTTVLKNGMCYYYLKDEVDSLPWEEAGHFCSDNTLGKLPIAVNPQDKALLASVIKGLDTNATGTWVGGQMEGDMCDMLLLSDSDTHQRNCSTPQPFLCTDAGKNPCPESKNGVDWFYFKGKCFYVWTRKDFNWMEADNFCKTDVGARTIDPLIYQEVYSAQYLVHKLGYGNDFWMAGVDGKGHCNMLPSFFEVRLVGCSLKSGVICVTTSEREINLRCPEALEGGKTFFEHGKCYAYHPEKHLWYFSNRVCEDTYKGSLPIIQVDKDKDILRFFHLSMKSEKGWLAGKIQEKCQYLITKTQFVWIVPCDDINKRELICVVPAKKQTTDSEQHCPLPVADGSWHYSKESDKCYLRMNAEYHWNGLEEFCKSMGLTLVSASMEKQDLVKMFSGSYIWMKEKLLRCDSVSVKDVYGISSLCHRYLSTVCEVPPKLLKTEIVRVNPCPEPSYGGEWVYNERHCYFISRFYKFTWREARNFCNTNLTATLPTLQNPREKLFLQSVVKSIDQSASYWVKNRAANKECSLLPDEKTTDCKSHHFFICVTEKDPEIEARCPRPKDGSKWWIINGTCYTYFPKLLSWFDAGKFCVENFAGHLPFVYENKALRPQLFKIMDSMGGNFGWVGDDRYLSIEGETFYAGMPYGIEKKKGTGAFFCAALPKLVEVKTS